MLRRLTTTNTPAEEIRAALTQSSYLDREAEEAVARAILADVRAGWLDRSAYPRRGGGRRRGRGLQGRWRAGGRSDGLRDGDDPAGGQDRGAGQHLCGAGEAPGVRPRGDRDAPGPDGGAGDRGRE